MTKEALTLLVHEMEYVLSCINEDKIPFDGDDFHEALRLGKEALAQQCVCGEPNSAGTHRTDGPCLALQQEQEPVAWRYALTVEGTEVAVRYDHANWNMKYEPFGRHGIDHGGKVTRKPVYTTPPQQSAIARNPLTDEEIDLLRSGYQSGRIGSFVGLCRAIEAAHGIKE